MQHSFRPQQGLLIMNFLITSFLDNLLFCTVSVPNRGYLLWIIKSNLKIFKKSIVSVPNRGYLLWITYQKKSTRNAEKWFPSPTGVTYYESEQFEHLAQTKARCLVSVPNRGYLLWILLSNITKGIFKDSFRPQQGLLIMN